MMNISYYYNKKIVDYIIANNINKVVIGNIKGIRENANLANKTNQKYVTGEKRKYRGLSNPERINAAV